MTLGARETAYEGAACGLLTLDAKGRIELANRLVGEWAGMAPETLLGE